MKGGCSLGVPLVVSTSCKKWSAKEHGDPKVLNTVLVAIDVFEKHNNSISGFVPKHRLNSLYGSSGKNVQKKIYFDRDQDLAH